jgi:signal transduction histidine kinase
MTARAVPWVASVFYGAVLLAGMAAADGPGWRLGGFAGGLALLAGLDVIERARYAAHTPARTAAALLTARVSATAVVLVLDRAEIAQVLIVLIPFQAYFTLGRLAGLTLAGTFLTTAPVVLTVTEPGWYRDGERVGGLLMLCLGLIMAVVMAAVAVEAETGRARLQQAQAELAELTASAERTRLARDIHDTVGHHLTAIAVQLEKSAAFRDIDPAAADGALTNARQSARLALGDVRAGPDRRGAMAATTLLLPHPGEPAPGYGLTGIRERVEALGGRMLVRSAQGVGTLLAVTVPRLGEMS